jgi:hypothetical protein
MPETGGKAGQGVEVNSIVDRLAEDARLISALLPSAALDGPVEIYLITFADDSGRFYIGKHDLPEGMKEDLEYLGSGRQLNKLPLEGRRKLQLLRVTTEWAALVEDLLVMKYRQEEKALCLNASVAQTHYFKYHTERMR